MTLYLHPQLYNSTYVQQNSILVIAAERSLIQSFTHLKQKNCTDVKILSDIEQLKKECIETLKLMKGRVDDITEDYELYQKNLSEKLNALEKRINLAINPTANRVNRTAATLFKQD